MTENSHLSLEDRWSIVALDKHAGWKQKDIAERLHCSPSTVCDLLKKYKQTGDVVDLQKSGRPPLIDISNNNNNNNNNMITNNIQTHRNATAKQLKHSVEDQLNISISAWTIWHLRKQLGYRPVHYRRRPLLTSEHKHKRYAYALDNLDNSWEGIIFTDECMFVLSDEHKVIWKRPHEKEIEKPCKEYPQKQMVWGGIHFHGRTNLHFVEGTVDANAYQKILQRHIVNTHMHDDFKMLQDGAKAHTAESTLHFCELAGIDIIQNPPSSPELNPIEKVWGWIKHALEKETITSLAHMRNRINFHWQNIPQNTIRQYIQHNQTVCNDIVVAGGGTIAEQHRHKIQQVR